jgi:hypothetical protein
MGAQYKADGAHLIRWAINVRQRFFALFLIIFSPPLPDTFREGLLRDSLFNALQNIFYTGVG